VPSTLAGGSIAMPFWSSRALPRECSPWPVAGYSAFYFARGWARWRRGRATGDSAGVDPRCLGAAGRAGPRVVHWPPPVVRSERPSRNAAGARGGCQPRVAERGWGPSQRPGPAQCCRACLRDERLTFTPHRTAWKPVCD